MNPEELHRNILELTRQYYEAAWKQKPFVPGQTPIPCSGKVFDAKEIQLLIEASLDFWLTAGRFSEQFEKQFASFLGRKHAMLCNSGSSANLLAVSALTSPQLEDRALQQGDEVITVAAGFPTTLNPILQNSLVPVFVDVELQTYNVDITQLEKAVTPKTKAVILAHTLGNPFNLREVTRIAKENNLWLIEDNCDALGSKYNGRYTGTFGDLATFSFYPAHQITMGEGGCVVTDSAKLKKIVESFRDWGRDCWCATGRDNTCGKRFEWQIGQLPHGYDHKYIYSHIGYNLKQTDMQAAVGVAQMQKLPGFIEQRKINWQKMYQGLKPFENSLILPQPSEHSEPSWFGFPLTVRKEAPFSRRDIVAHLEANKIGTRQIFGGNLVKQPAYQNSTYRCVGELKETDFVMERSFWVGVFPGITEPMLAYMLETFSAFLKKE